MYISLILVLSINAAMAAKSINFDKYFACGVGPTNPMKIHVLEIVYDKKIGFNFNMKAELRRDLNSETLKAVGRIERCISKEALDTCEKLSPMVVEKVCMIMNARNIGFDSVLDNFHPPLRCPYKKGNFSAQNAHFNVEMMKFLPIEKMFWKINISLYENKVYLASLCMNFAVVISRN